MIAGELEPTAEIRRFFEKLWRGYAEITPQAEAIRGLLEARGEVVRNDHVAFRTFDLAPVGVERLSEPLRAWGYEEVGRYDFPAKRLSAIGLSHPAGHPRVFLSELRTDELSPEARRSVASLVAEVDPDISPEQLLLGAGGWQPPRSEVWASLLAESEYAAWLAAFSLRANHFTVHVNDLRTFADLAELNAFLVEEGFALNAAGGVIKGGPEVLLAQSSTLASRIEWRFRGGARQTIPSCYYEFARRFTDPETGRLFDGFVTASADRIFESTDAKLPDARARNNH